MPYEPLLKFRIKHLKKQASKKTPLFPFKTRQHDAAFLS